MRQLVNMRLPVELLGRVDSVCGSRGRTEFVVRALEKALGAEDHVPERAVPAPSRASSSVPVSDPGGDVARVSPTRAPVRSAALERQARLNAARARK